MKSTIGIMIPKILLPKKSVNLRKWAVVACDQFTSQPDYWKEVADYTRGSHSSFNLIFPEVYLNKGNDDELIKKINENMKKYLDDNIFEEREGIIYVERTLKNGQIRKGLVLALDLEKYDYNKGSTSLIRATEGTIIDRLPPRIKIRKDALIELPHIMVLVDDPQKKTIEELGNSVSEMEVAYDSELMLDGGSIKGYWLSENQQEKVIINLMRLADKDLFKEKYSLEEERPVLLFAMGDGNHSLATAKAIWEDNKKAGLSMDDPSRYALVELVNLYDDSLEFEPIHRVLFGVKGNIIEEFKNYCSSKQIDFSYQTISSVDEILGELKKSKSDNQRIGFLKDGELGVISVSSPESQLAVGSLQKFLDGFVDAKKCDKLDYVHGEEAVQKLVQEVEGNCGFLLPRMSKNELFKTVIIDGALPRKTFSMGHAEDKRYYLEARKIK